MLIREFEARLDALREEAYRDFMARILPTMPRETILGVRTPDLRRLAKEFAKSPDCAAFLNDLPHRYFEENQLHAFLLSGLRDYDACIAGLRAFLPYVDNWATCDQMLPKCFSKHKRELSDEIPRWLASEQTYTVRYGIGILMGLYLDADFETAHLDAVARISSTEYYVNMMRAWYFATALAKQWDAAVKVVEEKRLDVWTHNKTIQKAVESSRITPEQKEYLKSLKIK